MPAKILSIALSACFFSGAFACKKQKREPHTRSNQTGTRTVDETEGLPRYDVYYSDDDNAAVVTKGNQLKVKFAKDEFASSSTTIVLGGKTGPAYKVTFQDGVDDGELVKGRMMTLCLSPDDARVFTGMVIGESFEKIAIVLSIKSLARKKLKNDRQYYCTSLIIPSDGIVASLVYGDEVSTVELSAV